MISCKLNFNITRVIRIVLKVIIIIRAYDFVKVYNSDRLTAVYRRRHVSVARFHQDIAPREHWSC